METRRAVWLGVALAIWLSSTLPAHALQQEARPGEVAGRVVDFDGTPLPAVTVEMIGPFPQSTARTALSDINARFVFTDLAPGRYRLSIELPDLSAGSDLDVTVRAGQRTEATLVLSLQGTAVNVIVRAEAPAIADTDLFDSESTAGRQIVPGTTIENMPLPAEQALEVLPLLPSVVRGPKGQIAIDGTMPSDSVLLFNGIDLMDGYSGDYNVRLPIEAIDSVDLFTGVAPANFGNMTGGIIDVTTTPGGESWDYGVASVFPRPYFKDGTVQGIKNASPRLSVSGPLKSGETYLSIAGEYHFDRVEVYDIPGDPNQDHVRLEGWNAFAQVDWHPEARHGFTIAGLVFPSFDKYVGLDGLTPPQATLNIERDAEAILGRYTYRPEADRSLVVTGQFNRIGVGSEGQGNAPYEVLTGGFDGNHFHGEDRQTSHFQSQVIYKRRFGASADRSHVMQIGGDFHRLHLSGELTDDTILVRGAQQQLLRRIDFTTPSTLRDNQYEWSFFLQDRWTLSERLWLDLGGRYSSDSFTRDDRFDPRFGVAWDPAGDRRTLLKGGVGVLHRRVYLGEITWRAQPTRLVTIYDDEGATLFSLVPRIGEALEAPRTVQISGDISHRLRSGWMLRARYSHRRTDENIVVDPVLGTGMEIDPEIDPLLQYESGSRDGALLLSSNGQANSWSVELTAARRIPSGGEFVVTYVRSSSFGDLNDFRIMTAEFPDPIIRPNERAQRAFDVPHRVVAWGTFELPREILLSPVVEWRTGFPYSLLAEDQQYAGPANTQRFPDFFSFDVQGTKAFEIKGYRITGGVKITNITGRDNPRQVVANVADPQFGDLRNSVPFRVRAVFNLRF